MAIDTRRYITEDRSLGPELRFQASRVTNLTFAEVLEITDLRENQVTAIGMLADGQEYLADGWCWFKRKDDQSDIAPEILSEEAIESWSEYFDEYGELPEEAINALLNTARAAYTRS